MLTSINDYSDEQIKELEREYSEYGDEELRELVSKNLTIWESEYDGFFSVSQENVKNMSRIQLILLNSEMVEIWMK